MTVSSSVIQTNISTWKRDNTDVPVFGIINFKFVNISHAVWDLFLAINVYLILKRSHRSSEFQNILFTIIFLVCSTFTLNDQKGAISCNVIIYSMRWLYL